LLCRGGPLEAQDWTLVVPRSDGDTFAGELAEQAVTLDAAGFDQLRIEKGLPTWGHELSSEVTPLETNLISAISFSKGCYTGQEVIARQTNYDKVTRRLVGLILDEGAPTSLTGGVIPGPGRGGIVTSSTDTSRFGVIALAIVPRDLAEPGTTVTVQQGEHTYPARITSLPFAHL
jgi:folate-binding protein YgfZ